MVLVEVFGGLEIDVHAFKFPLDSSGHEKNAVPALAAAINDAYKGPL